MPYTTEEMLDDFRKDVARLTAENARLRAACEAVLAEAIAVEMCIVRNGAQDIHCIGNSAIKMQNDLRAALNPTEPSDAK